MEKLVTEVEGHLHHLAEQIGNRLIGTPGNQAAAAYIADHFRSAGLEVTLQEFPCPDWKAICTSLVLDEAPLEAWANTFSPPCNLVSEIVPVGTFTELQTAQITGKIPLFYGELAQHELAARRAIYVPERDREIIQILEERAPAALVTVNPLLDHRWRLVEDFDLNLPSATVSARVGQELLKRAGQPVHLEIVTHRKPSSSANVVGRLEGSLPERIVLCAHYDTKEDTPGAYDNASGVAALLSLASRLAGEAHRYGLEFIAFSGEEGYGMGDMEYARQVGETGFQEVRAAINMDGVGPLLSVNSVATFSAPESLNGLVDRIQAKFPGITRVEPWPASDHYIFYSHGVPSVAIGSVGIHDIYHTPEDTLAWLSPERVAEAACFAFELVESLDQSPSN